MLLTSKATCGIIKPVENVGRFILPEYIALPERLTFSTNAR